MTDEPQVTHFYGDECDPPHGRRRDDVGPNNLPPDLAVGDYWKVSSGAWHVACALWPDADGADPSILDFAIANLGGHMITEHEDGTITASPSILITGHHGQWHGFLERGELRTA